MTPTAKTDAQFGHQVALLASCVVAPARRDRGNLIPLGALVFQVAAVASGATL